MRRPLGWMMCLLVVGLGGSSLVAAGRASTLNDHLLCYRTRDLRHLPAQAQLTITPERDEFLQRLGCKVMPGPKPRARRICIAADKTPSRPPVGIDLPEGFICYGLSCERTKSPRPVELDLADQFGAGTFLTHQGSAELCVPVPRSTPSPTPSPSLTPTPTDTPTPTPTPTMTPTASVWCPTTMTGCFGGSFTGGPLASLGSLRAIVTDAMGSLSGTATIAPYTESFALSGTYTCPGCLECAGFTWEVGTHTITDPPFDGNDLRIRSCMCGDTFVNAFYCLHAPGDGSCEPMPLGSFQGGRRACE